MSAALNNLMPGNVNRLWGKRDFQGLAACYGKVFFSMQVSESRLVNKMPVLFLAGFLQVANSDPACLSSTWWKDESKCLKKLGLAVKKVCSELYVKGEKLLINHFAKIFVAGIALISYLVEDDYNFRDISEVIDALHDEDPTEYRIPARMLEQLKDSLKIVHPNFHAEFEYNLNLHVEIAKLGKIRKGGKGKVSKLKKYAEKEEHEVVVACFLPFAKDIAYMLEEVGRFVNEVRLNGYFQHVANIFEGVDEKETKNTKYPKEKGRALLMAIPITVPHLIEKEFDKDASVKAILERLPLVGGFGKPRRKRKQGRTPSPTQSEIDLIHTEVLGSEGSDEGLESGQE